MNRRLRNIGIASSQLFHVLATLGNGDPKMTTSARIGRQVYRGRTWAKNVDRVLSFALRDPRHCIDAYWADKARRMAGGDHQQ
jgi:hypothetical protein